MTSVFEACYIRDMTFVSAIALLLLPEETRVR